MDLLKRKLWLLGGSFLILLVFLFTWVNHSTNDRKRVVVIGGKNTTETHLLGELLAQLIEEKTEYRVLRRFYLDGTTVCFQALQTGGIDIYFEYTGTILLDILKETHFSTDLYSYVSNQLFEKYHLVLLDRLGVSNGWALIVRTDSGMKTLSEFAEKSGTSLGHCPELQTRKEMELLAANYPREMGWKGRIMDQALLYVSLINGAMDGITGGITDGRTADPRLTVLEDDMNCLPNYEIAPMTTPMSLENFPELDDLYKLMVGNFTEKDLRQYNSRVEFGKSDFKSVAREALKERGLI